MIRNIKLVTCLLIPVISFLMLTACGEPDIVGEYNSDYIGEVEFTSSGEYYFENDDIHGTYTVEGNELTLNRSNGKSQVWTYELSDEILTITSSTGKSYTMHRTD